MRISRPSPACVEKAFSVRRIGVLTTAVLIWAGSVGFISAAHPQDLQGATAETRSERGTLGEAGGADVRSPPETHFSFSTPPKGAADMRPEGAAVAASKTNPANVTVLTRALADRDPEVRHRAVKNLGEIAGDGAITPLIAALQDDAWLVRMAALDALVKVPEVAVGPLIVALKDERPTVQMGASWALAKLGRAAVTPLIAALKDPNPGVRNGAAKALAETKDDRAVAPLISALGDSIAAVRAGAAGALGRIGDKRAVEPLVAFLDDSDSRVRQSAGWALGHFADERAVAPLIGALRDEDSGVRRTAARSLRNLGDGRAVLPLVEALRDDDREVRHWAGRALGEIRDPRAVGSLVVALQDTQGLVRASAAEGLGKVGDREAIVPLIDALADPDAAVRTAAVEALGVLGDSRSAEPVEELRLSRNQAKASQARRQGQNARRRSRDYVEDVLAPPTQPPEVAAEHNTRAFRNRLCKSLISALRDPDRRVRSSACWALGNLADRLATIPLIAVLGDEQGPVRARAVQALGKIKDPLALSPLVASLKDENDLVRRRAAAALAGMGDPDVEPLIAALRDGEERVRILAAEVLGEVRDGRAVRPLIALLRDSSPEVRRAAAAALGDLQDGRAVASLIALLNDPEPEVRIGAAEALGKIGEPAVESLVDALKDATSDARAYAFEALAQVGEAALEPLVAALRDQDASVRNDARFFLLFPVEEFITSSAARGRSARRSYGTRLSSEALPAGPGREVRGGTTSALVELRDRGRSSLLHLQAMRGPRHPEVARTLHDLSLLEAAMGNREEALGLARRARDIEEFNFCFVLIAGSEEQKRAYAERLTASISATVSLHTRYAAPDPDAVNLALRTVLRRKGLTLDAMTYALASLRRRLEPSDGKLLDEWLGLLEQESSLHGRRGEASGDDRSGAIAELNRRRQAIEQELRGRSGAFWQLSDLPTLDEIQDAIPEDAALVEIVAYEPVSWHSRESPRYLAYVLRREGEPRWADLGEAASVDSVAARLLQVLGRPRRRWGGSGRAIARNLYVRLVEPIEPFLDGTRHLLISADGMLNLVPLGALADRKGRFLLERYTVTYLTAGRDLLRLDDGRETRGPPLILAGPDFDTEGGNTPSEQQGALTLRSSRSADLSGIEFAPLSGAVEEGRALGRILPDADLRVGRDATEEVLKRVRGPQILHIATHGFFLPDQLESGPENPLLRSGLALAGANLRRSRGEDGVLTALEASGLDLRGTQLVVLSACETGMGETRNGEGVYGLRRALAVTGAETQVTSLWKVSDEATRSFMVAYYERLLTGEGRSEALRQVQLEMLRSRDLDHPFYWASFLPVGDWRPLEIGSRSVASRRVP